MRLLLNSCRRAGCAGTISPMNPAFLVAAVTASAAAAITAPSGSAERLFADADFAAAYTAYVKRASVNPHDAAALSGLATLALYQNRLDTAREAAWAALRLHPGNRVAVGVLRTIAERREVVDSATALPVPEDGITLPFLQSDPLPVIEVRVDGRAAPLVLDTGAPDITLSPDFARTLGLQGRSAG
ncbi:MAG: aspartyl protease family protein, partial [Candidatus Eremiobacteraeota bacterium]|nr:aspartyl protease family protein [Candidatus Eremiobacteraeota bacterium]